MSARILRVATLGFVLVLGLVSLQRAVVRAQGTPTLPVGTSGTDSFDDPSTGIVQKSVQGDGYQGGYFNSEYQLALTDPNLGGAVNAHVAASYTDVTVDVDARVVGDVDGRFVALGCRRALGTLNGYRIEVAPASGLVFLVKLEDGRNNVLVRTTSSAVHLGNDANHLQLMCSGTTIRGSVNGSSVFSIDDAAYKAGMVWLAAGMFTGTGPGLLDARFDNLAVTVLNASSNAGSGTQSFGPLLLFVSPAGYHIGVPREWSMDPNLPISGGDAGFSSPNHDVWVVVQVQDFAVPPDGQQIAAGVFRSLEEGEEQTGTGPPMVVSDTVRQGADSGYVVGGHWTSPADGRSSIGLAGVLIKGTRAYIATVVTTANSSDPNSLNLAAEQLAIMTSFGLTALSANDE